MLDSDELAALAAALDRLEDRYPASVSAIRVAALTGLRISEVCSIRWEHVDFEHGRVTLPETKTGRRVHDFPDAALAVMRSRPRLNRNDHVFAVDARGPLTYRTVRTHFAAAARLAGLTDVRLHDLRRTVMTHAAAAGVGTHVLRDLLGHKSTAMADRYVRQVGSPVADARRAIGAAMAAAMVRGGGPRLRIGTVVVILTFGMRNRRKPVFDDDKLYLAGDPDVCWILGSPSTLAHWRSAGSWACVTSSSAARVAYRGSDLNAVAGGVGPLGRPTVGAGRPRERGRVASAPCAMYSCRRRAAVPTKSSVCAGREGAQSFPNRSEPVGQIEEPPPLSDPSSSSDSTSRFLGSLARR